MSAHSPESIEFWAETRLKEALNDNEKIDRASLSLAVGFAHGEPPRTAIKTTIAEFILGALGLEVSFDEHGPRVRVVKEVEI